MKTYYTVQNGDKSKRHRIVNNLLGPQTFCPIVRRTKKLSRLDSTDLRKRCEDIVTAYPPELVRRALGYLYNKETKFSFEIEHIKPNGSRTQKFITSLEAFSQPLLQLTDYQLDKMGQITVENDTMCWYQYMDMTPQAEALYEFVTRTIEEEIVEELGFLANYDNTKKAIQKIIDMPDRLIDLFIQFCLQNNKSLSTRKRSAHFDFLTDEEVTAMEQAVKYGYNKSE